MGLGFRGLGFRVSLEGYLDSVGLALKGGLMGGPFARYVGILDMFYRVTWMFVGLRNHLGVPFGTWRYMEIRDDFEGLRMFRASEVECIAQGFMPL